MIQRAEQQRNERVLPEIGKRRPRRQRNRVSGNHQHVRTDKDSKQTDGFHLTIRFKRFRRRKDTMALWPRFDQIQS